LAFWKKFFRPRGGDIRWLQRRLDRFRDLVEKNNLVLQLIADAGEKLGGEYVFDVQYLKTLARDLERATREVAHDLNIITGNGYPRLAARCHRIDSDIQAILESRVVVPRAPLVIPMDKLDNEMANVAGEKMARLGEIGRRLGCRVPPGFVISAHACRVFLERSGVLQRAENEAELASLPERILQAKIPRKLRLAIRRSISSKSFIGDCHSLAVRSSATGEDGKESFAGQYKTVLGVKPADVLRAYREVIASLYSPGVIAYRRGLGLPPGRGLMAVGCLGMVPAAASGVVYTLNPSQPRQDMLVIAVAHGLGKAVVDGMQAVDRYEISRRAPHAVLSRRMATQEKMYIATSGGGVEHVQVKEGLRGKPAISDAQLAELTATALRIERYMKCAQDIEWALDEKGQLFIIQARPLRIEPERITIDHDLSQLSKHYPVLLKGRGDVACRGIGYGIVRRVDEYDSLDSLSRGVVIVAKASSPKLAAAMAEAEAVITDVGTATGHLAAVAREFRVPTIVDTGNATQVLHDGQEVTVDAEENVVYQGRVEELLHSQLLRTSSYEDSAEFRMLRRMLAKIAPLNLKDPQASNFSPSNCKTYHDIIRFAHEKAVAELTTGHLIRPRRGGRYVRRLDLPIPLDLIMVDLGGSISSANNSRVATIDDVVSRPLRPLLDELIAEGVWETGPADMDLDGFMSSATRSVALAGPLSTRPQQNLAIVSSEYLHLSLRLGYHFNIVDSYLTDTRNDNYLYFRFAGGVTELSRRSRRALLLKRILEEHDFVVESKGDLVIGRIKKISATDMTARLKMIGRLIGFTRQLDIFLRDDELVDRCVKGFLAGKSNPRSC